MPDPPPLRIAMWSGPRNISTALLRAWGNRSDTFVCDEPLYAFYLSRTRLAHPVAEEIIARYETDWRKVVDWLTGPTPEGKPIFYQKQMAHHLLPEVGREWLARVTNVFLIRDPREMLTSYIKIREQPTLDDLGLPQQREIFDWVRKREGRPPVVLDSKDVLDDPPGMLRALCGALGVEFTDAMLSWPPGLRPTDGVWAPHWYGEVAKSTTFRPYRPKNEAVPDHLADLHAACQEIYQMLYEHRLRV